MSRIIIITRAVQARRTLTACFEGYRVDVAIDRDSGLTLVGPEPCEYLFLDVAQLFDRNEGNHRSYRAELDPFRKAFPNAHLVILSTPELIREAVNAVKAGAESYLTHPVTPEEVGLVRESIEEAMRARAELDYLRDPFWRTEAQDLVRTESALMRDVLTKVRQVAPTKSTVLLTGETGTGKNLLAKLIHRHSNRADKQFISVHCGAITDTLLESELFGHERGAFTGAVRKKLGKFEIADGGTIFLDEIGTITPAMQVKLLQVLQERSFHRVGGERAIGVDVRILAATNMDLKQAVESGSFRRDLYFRLNVFPIEVPPLRERREDIAVLTATFVGRMNALYSKDIAEVHPLVLEAFARYEWPGNVRELESLIERGYILETSPLLTPESFPGELFESAEVVSKLPFDKSEPLSLVRQRCVENIERLYLKAQLSATDGRINLTARAAGITERQLHKLMVKHGLHKEDFRAARRIWREKGTPGSGE